MLIKREQLKIRWYEDGNCNDLGYPSFDSPTPDNAEFQISRFPCQLTTSHHRLVKRDVVDKCRHPRKYIHPTYGWIDGVVGRECKLCHGTQTKKKWHLWPRKWDACGSRPVFEAHQGWQEDLALAIANSGDYTLSEAIIIAATSCERCMNALAYKYGLEWGYAEGSDEWQRCGTSCQFCREE
jgi:hypothetical protein